MLKIFRDLDTSRGYGRIGDNKVLLKDGTEKKTKDLQPGDTFWSMDKSGKFITKTVENK
jgi:hypothetical protein